MYVRKATNGKYSFCVVMKIVEASYNNLLIEKEWKSVTKESNLKEEDVEFVVLTAKTDDFSKN